MHKNLPKLSKIEDKEEKKSQAELGQSLVKTIPNWLKMSQSAKGGAEKKRLSKLSVNISFQLTVRPTIWFTT